MFGLLLGEVHVGGLPKRNSKNLPVDCIWGQLCLRGHSCRTKAYLNQRQRRREMYKERDEEVARSTFCAFASLTQLKDALNKFLNKFFCCINELLEKYV